MVYRSLYPLTLTPLGPYLWDIRGRRNPSKNFSSRWIKQLKFMLETTEIRHFPDRCHLSLPVWRHLSASSVIFCRIFSVAEKASSVSCDLLAMSVTSPVMVETDCNVSVETNSSSRVSSETCVKVSLPSTSSNSVPEFRLSSESLL